MRRLFTSEFFRVEETQRLWERAAKSNRRQQHALGHWLARTLEVRGYRRWYEYLPMLMRRLEEVFPPLSSDVIERHYQLLKLEDASVNLARAFSGSTSAFGS